MKHILSATVSTWSLCPVFNCILKLEHRSPFAFQYARSFAPVKLLLRTEKSIQIPVSLIQTAGSLSSDGSSLFWTFSGIQTQTGEGDPSSKGAAIASEQSPRRTLQLFELTSPRHC